MMNMIAIKDFALFIPQLIVDIEWTNKMRKAYNTSVKKGDVIPHEYFTMSVAETSLTNWLTSSIKDETGKVMYKTINLECSHSCKPTLRSATLIIQDKSEEQDWFTYEDL